MGFSSRGSIIKVSPLQIVTSLFAIIGTGFTVIMYSNGGPTHPFKVGVIV